MLSPVVKALESAVNPANFAVKINPMRDITLWAINIGKNAEAESLFLSKSIVGPGLAKIPDLSYAGDREAFKVRYQQSYPETRADQLTVLSSQMFRFVQEMGDGDFVVFPARISRKVYLGQITGNYTFRPSMNENFPHQRPVRWLKEFSRTQFSQGALFELSSTLTVFKIKAHLDEFRAALERKLAAPEDKIVPSAAIASDEIEEQTRDFIARNLASLSRKNFQSFAVGLLEKMGYHTSAVSSDETAAHLIAHKGLLGIEPPAVKVQIRFDKKLTKVDVETFLQGSTNEQYGLIITAGPIPAAVWESARAHAHLRLIDITGLADLVFALYDRLDLRQQQMLPLKKIFVPDTSVSEGSD